MRTPFILAGLGAAVFLAFAPSLGNNFLSYDDSLYVTGNPHVLSGLTGANVRWALTATYASNWHPLTWISHQIDVSLFGLNPFGHHLVNLVLHTANTLLLFLWLCGATGKTGRSVFVAALFGLHPLHVESVAWIAERKDVLCTFFWMLALMSYTAYARKPGIGRYLGMAVFFVLALAAKPMAISFPLQILVLDWWPMERVGRRPLGLLCVEKIPLALISALSAWTAVWAQRRGGSLIAFDHLPLGLRLGNAAISYARYLGKAIWPVHLAVFYPYRPGGVAAWAVIGSLALLAAISVVAILNRNRRPWLLAGWAWFLLTLAPAIGIIQVGLQAMADRYMYVPLIGLAIAVAWEAAERWRRPGIVAVSAAIVLAVCAILTWKQAHVWRDGVTLFTHAAAVTDGNFVAHDNLGVEYDRLGRPDDALAEYRETIRIKPGDRHGEENYANATFAKGEKLFRQGSLDQALTLFRDGLAHQPLNADAHMFTGLILTERNEIPAARSELREALRLNPNLARAHLGLGVVLARSGDPASGRRELRESLRLEPSVEANFDLGIVEAAMGNAREALTAFDAALRLQPDYAPALAARKQVADRARSVPR